jgi:hypothetical protein
LTVAFGVGDVLFVATAKNPNGLPGSIAPRKVVPTGLTEAEKLPFEVGFVMLPPKLTTFNVVGSKPLGTVTVPVTVVAGTVVNEKL